MLIKVSHAKYTVMFTFLAVAVVAGFFLGTKDYLSSSSESAKGNSDTSLQAKTDLLSPTDKTELAAEALVEPPQVPTQVVTAEAQLPVATAPAYKDACQELKTMYTTERDGNLNKENATFKLNQQEIMNKYSKDGMSFSSMQKSAQAKELKRHNTMVEQINKLFQKQLKTISC